ncbi:unnamed protein product, partial [Rotaria sordida]
NGERPPNCACSYVTVYFDGDRRVYDRVYFPDFSGFFGPDFHDDRYAFYFGTYGRATDAGSYVAACATYPPPVTDAKLSDRDACYRHCCPRHSNKPAARYVARI